VYVKLQRQTDGVERETEREKESARAVDKADDEASHSKSVHTTSRLIIDKLLMDTLRYHSNTSSGSGSRTCYYYNVDYTPRLCFIATYRTKTLPALLPELAAAAAAAFTT